MDASMLQNEKLPEHIRTKYQLFLEQEKTIHRLEAELENLREEHSELEEELAPYQAYIKHEVPLFRSKHWKITYPRNRGPIHACPEEVLYEIFQYYLAFQHYRIPDLLLVCKTWYDIIMGNPRFWARIQTPTVDRYDACSTVIDDITIPYIEACLERSRDLPMDIELDLSWMPSTHDYILHHASTALECITDTRAVRDSLSSIEWSERHFSYMHRFLDILQDDVESWRRLSITFPYGEAEAKAVLKKISLEKATLQSLELLNIGSKRISYWDGDTDLLPDVSSIKYLNSSLPLSEFSGSPSSLVELKIIATKFSDIQEIFSCSMLQSLTLEMREVIHRPKLRRKNRSLSDSEFNLDVYWDSVLDNWYDYDWNDSTIVPDEPLPSLHLSALKKLTIIGLFEPLSLFDFDLSVLEWLEIYPRGQRNHWSGSHETIPMPELPKVSPRGIHLRMPSWKEDNFIPGLSRVLSQFQEAEIMKITIPFAHSSILMVLLKLYSTNKSMIINSPSVTETRYQKELNSILVCLQNWANENGYSVTLQSDLDIDREFPEE